MSLTDAYVVKKNSEKRRTNDFYPTAPIATLSLLKNHHVPTFLWEPAAGRGHITKELRRNHHIVRSSDLNEYEDSLVDDIETGVDFLTAPLKDVDGVITNPPYLNDLPQKFIERFTKEYGFVAVFARLTFMESAKRFELFSKNPPSDIYVFSQRIQCSDEYFHPKEKQIGGMVAYAWFVWDKTGFDGDTRTKWIKPSNYLGLL